ncbi:MAG: hypothetical protein EP147_00265 [Subdoligranulum sp.]|nr:hypothetical protein [Subdoligranulum sp.]
MPEGYTHVRTAQKAATAIHYKVQCPAAFAAGANGPDSFFCYEVWKKRAKRHFDLPTLGNRMHEEKTGEFLRSLCRHVKSRPQVEYALGFLSHYAADTVVHPFVYAMCQPGQPYAGPGARLPGGRAGLHPARGGHRQCAGARQRCQPPAHR